MAATPTPEEQLDFFIDKFTPEIAALARRVLARMRHRLPGAVEFVYDNYYALAIGFGPSERPSDAILSVVLYPRWTHLYFLQGAVLPDPAGRLKGSGKAGRHLVVHDDAVLDDPDVRTLIDDAVAFANPPFEAQHARKLLIRAVAEKQRGRRPAKTAARYSPHSR
jgi:hypothetical protein